MSDASNVLVGAAVFDALGGCLGHVAALEGGVLEVDCVGGRGVRLHIPLEWVDEVSECVRLCRTWSQVLEDSPPDAAASRGG